VRVSFGVRKVPSGGKSFIWRGSYYLEVEKYHLEGEYHLGGKYHLAGEDIIWRREYHMYEERIVWRGRERRGKTR
jgi:hypothetical protein